MCLAVPAKIAETEALWAEMNGGPRTVNLNLPHGSEA